MEHPRGGGMHTYLDEQGCMTKAGARGCFRRLLLALQHCHQRGTVLRDLTLSSVLLDENQKVKILGFGLSNEYNPREKLDTFCGTAAYTSPELVLGWNYMGPPVDVWSLDVVLQSW